MTKPYIVRDQFFKKAKQEGLRARSAYKLEEIQKKYRLVRPGHVVTDLGAAPGSWTQMLSRWVEAGRVVAIDLQEIQPIAPNVEVHQADMMDVVKIREIVGRPVDGVVADLSPKTTGMHDVDAYRSAELNESVLDFCETHLKKNGYLVTKIFHGEEFADVLKRTKSLFKRVNVFKPDATRDRSRETYIIGQIFKGPRL